MNRATGSLLMVISLAIAGSVRAADDSSDAFDFPRETEPNQSGVELPAAEASNLAVYSIEKQMAFGLRYGSALGLLDDAEARAPDSVRRATHHPWYHTGEFFAVELCNVACMWLGVSAQGWLTRSGEWWETEAVYTASNTLLSPALLLGIDDEFSLRKGSLIGGMIGTCAASLVPVMLSETLDESWETLGYVMFSALILPPLGTLIGYHL